MARSETESQENPQSERTQRVSEELLFYILLSTTLLFSTLVLFVAFLSYKQFRFLTHKNKMESVMAEFRRECKEWKIKYLPIRVEDQPLSVVHSLIIPCSLPVRIYNFPTFEWQIATKNIAKLNE